jgi:hypothetical protein
MVNVGLDSYIKSKEWPSCDVFLNRQKRISGVQGF